MAWPHTRSIADGVFGGVTVLARFWWPLSAVGVDIYAATTGQGLITTLLTRQDFVIVY